MSRPELAALVLGDAPQAWEALGFTVDGSAAVVGGVELRLTGEGGGIRDWVVAADVTARPASPGHPNGALAVDHVVLLASDLAATTERLVGEGFDHRPSPAPQEFFVLGPCLLEVVQGDRDGLWGLTLTVADLDALAARLGDLLGTPKDAVQPGRRIATLRREAGLGQPVAFMTPR